MQGNANEIFEPVKHIWGNEKREEGKDANQKIFPRKFFSLGVDENKSVNRVFKYSSPGVKKDLTNNNSESGKLKENLLFSPILQQKTWVYSTPSTRLKEKKSTPEVEESIKKFKKTQYNTPLSSIDKKNIGHQIFSNSHNMLLNSESLEDESFQRKEKKKTVEMLKSLKENNYKSQVQETEQNLEDLEELVNKCYELRENQIEFLTELMYCELPDIHEIPSSIFQYYSRLT